MIIYATKTSLLFLHHKERQETESFIMIGRERVQQEGSAKLYGMFFDIFDLKEINCHFR